MPRTQRVGGQREGIVGLADRVVQAGNPVDDSTLRKNSPVSVRIAMMRSIKSVIIWATWRSFWAFC
jgi:hypothetical protein